MIKKNGFGFLLGLVLTLTCLYIPLGQAQETKVKILANPSVQTSELTLGQLRRIFSMRQTNWPDGQPIRVFVLENQHQTHQQLCKQILQMFPYQMEKLWNKLVYSGLGDYPNIVKSETEMLASLARYPGAVGYVSANVNAPGLENIKVSKE